jgi:hypothetical protein
MGALFSGPPHVPAIPPVPPTAAPPTLANPSSSQAGAATRQAAAAAFGAGFNGTVTNAGGAAGLIPAPGQTAPRSLLG